MMARGSGLLVQDLPDPFKFPYRRKDADAKETQEQYFPGHLSAPYV
jgi:hypothetical protein